MNSLREAALNGAKEHGLGEWSLKSFRDDKEVVLAAVTNYHGSSLLFASEALRNDKEVVLAAVTNDGESLQHASKSLQNDKEVVLAAVRNIRLHNFPVEDVVIHGTIPPFNYAPLSFASKSLQNDKEVVLVAVKYFAESLGFASESLRNDKEFILAAVKSNGDSFRFASESLRNDREVVLAAVKSNGYSLRDASESLRNDREVVLAAVKSNGASLECASESFRNDREVVLVAVANEKNIKDNIATSLALQCASESLRDDKEVVLAAVTNDGKSLRYASKSLQDDKEVVLAAIKNIQHRNDTRFVAGIVDRELKNFYSWYPILRHASESLQNDKEVVLAALTNDGPWLEYAPETLDDRDYHETRYYGKESLEYASESLRNDKDVVLAAVKNYGLSLRYASQSLQNDKEVVLTAVKSNGCSLGYASESLRKEKEVVLAGVKQSGEYVLRFAHDSFQQDKDVAEAVRVDRIKRCLGQLAENHPSHQRETALRKLKQHAVDVKCDVVLLASQFGAPWSVLERLVTKYPEQLLSCDEETGLYPFMLSASSPHPSCVGAIFNMLKRFPKVVRMSVTSCQTQQYKKRKVSALHIDDETVDINFSCPNQNTTSL